MGLEKFEELRKQKKMTLNELSETSGIPISTLKKISAGITKNPNLETVQAIARALQCSIDEFDGLGYEIPALCANIKKARNNLGLTLEEVAAKVGVSSPTMQRYERGAIKNIPIDKIERIAEILNVDPVVLMGLKDPTLLETKPQTRGHDLVDISQFTKIPILGEIRCGEPMYAEGNIEGYAYAYTDSLNSGYNYFFLRAKGDSMINAGINPGDRLLIRVQNDVDSGDIAVVNVNGDEETLKRVIKKQDAIILQPENPAHETKFFFREEINGIHIQGRLMQVIKNY